MPTYKILTYQEWSESPCRAAWVGRYGDIQSRTLQRIQSDCNRVQGEHVNWYFIDAKARHAYGAADWAAFCVADVELQTPLQKLIDGRTLDQCFDLYVSLMRSDGAPGNDVLSLTARQYEAAKDEWSRRLHELQETNRQKEHNRVVCDGIFPDDLP